MRNFLFWFVISTAGSIAPAEDMERSEISVQVLEVKPEKAIKIRLQNLTTDTVRIWRSEANSWGWGIWTFAFSNDKFLDVFVRNPDEIFTGNVPESMMIPPGAVNDLSFDLKDGSWVSHKIPMFKSGFTGGFVFLGVPQTEEAKKLGVWTGSLSTSF